MIPIAKGAKYLTKLKSHRLASRISQKDIAHSAGISPSHMCELESGKSKPSMKTLKAIAKVMCVPVYKLID